MSSGFQLPGFQQSGFQTTQDDGTIVQTLPSLTQATTGKSTATSTVDQTLPSLTQATNVVVSRTGGGHFVTGIVIHNLTPVEAIIAQRLPSLTQEVLGEVSNDDELILLMV